MAPEDARQGRCTRGRTRPRQRGSKTCSKLRHTQAARTGGSLYTMTQNRKHHMSRCLSMCFMPSMRSSRAASLHCWCHWASLQRHSNCYYAVELHANQSTRQLGHLAHFPGCFAASKPYVATPIRGLPNTPTGIAFFFFSSLSLNTNPNLRCICSVSFILWVYFKPNQTVNFFRSIAVINGQLLSNEIIAV